MKHKKAKYTYRWDRNNNHAVRIPTDGGWPERWGRTNDGIKVTESGIDWTIISQETAPTITYRQWFNWVHFGQVPQFTMPTLDTKEVMEVTTTTTTTPITNETSNH